MNRGANANLRVSYPFVRVVHRRVPRPVRRSETRSRGRLRLPVGETRSSSSSTHLESVLPGK